MCIEPVGAELALRRAAIAQKCKTLKLIDEEAEKGGAIFQILSRVYPKVGYAERDTIEKLLKLEGVDYGKA